MTMESQLIDKRLVAEGTMEFRFKRPPGFEFKAGQYLDLFLVNPPETDSEGSVRTFSITSTPSDQHLAIATRLRDTAFKRVLKSAEISLPVKIEGPMGSFTLHQNVSRPAVMLAGGIGVTPFRSIIKDAFERELTHTIYLFYSNRRPEDAAYLNELEELANQHSNFKFVPTMTNLTNPAIPWSGATGYIDQELLAKNGVLNGSPVYYVAGPLTMVTAMRQLLTDMGVSDDGIKTEEFAGY
jgi:ferredoxin-NADP reductase